MSVLLKLLPALFLTPLISCDQPISSTSQEIKNSGEQADITHKQKPITFYKVSGQALLLGRNIKLLDSTFQEVQDISRFHEQFVNVTEVSHDYYFPSSGGDSCDRFKYVKIGNGEFDGYIDGRYLYESGKDLKNKFLTIDGKNISLVTTHHFAIGTTDEDGLTFCSIRTPALFSENDPSQGQLVKMIQNEKYSDPYPYLELKSDDQADDEILSIEKKGEKYLVKIKRIYQEGEAEIHASIYKNEKGEYVAEIVQK